MVTLAVIYRPLVMECFDPQFLRSLENVEGMLPGNTAELFSLRGLAGVLETFGALLIVLGLFTRPVAFLLSGQMVVAYFMAHMPNALFPIENGGELAALYAFIFLFFAANGAGALSLDRFRPREGSVAEVREAAVAR